MQVMELTKSNYSLELIRETFTRYSCSLVGNGSFLQRKMFSLIEICISLSADSITDLMSLLSGRTEKLVYSNVYIEFAYVQNCPLRSECSSATISVSPYLLRVIIEVK